MSVDICTKEEKEAIRDALGDFQLRHALRQGVPALRAPRHRPPPRGPPAEVPPARREAGAAGAAQGRERHRHAGRGRQHPDPHACCSRSSASSTARRPASSACATSSRSPGAPGARASTSAAASSRRRPRTSSRTGASPPSRRPARRSSCRSRPTKGYVHWDKGTFERLVNGTPEPLESRFEVTHGMLLNCLQSEAARARRGGGYRRLVDAHRALARRRARASAPSGGARRPASATLRRAGHRRRRARPRRARGRVVEVSAELQRDFSLNQTLSLYLLEALGGARPRRARPTRSTC